MSNHQKDGAKNGVPSDDKNISCPECNMKGEKPNQKWIYCGICTRGFDITCQNITKQCYTNIGDREDMFWICKDCMQIYCKDKDRKKGVLSFPKPNQDDAEKDAVTMELHGLDTENKINTKYMEDKLDELLEMNTNIKTTIDHLHVLYMEKAPNIEEKVTTIETKTTLIESKFQTLQDSMSKKIDEATNGIPKKIEEVTKDIPKSWAEAVKSNQTPNANQDFTVEKLKQALAEVAEADKEKEIRSRGLVIYRAPEEEEEGNSQNQTIKDKDLVINLLEFLEVESEDLISVNRLGRFSKENIDERKFRPLKVRLSTNEIRDKVLNNLKKLKNAPEEFKSLSIRQDLDFKQRQELHSFFKKAKERTENNPGKIYRVRGMAGDYRIVEFTKN